MAERIPLQELESYLWGSAVLLRTNIDAGAYKQYIFPLLFFKRICDVYDEETEKAKAEMGEDIVYFPEEEIHTFLIPQGHHWSDVRKVTEDIGKALIDSFRAIEKANGDKMTGIFGDGAWTNKNRLPDRLLRELLEHFSSKNLSLESCPEDELGQGYEYLIKQFADDSGHTAQEFYTNRTVVHLMTEILQPQPGESVYDPTCGSAGMLISCIAHLKNQGKEWRNLKLYGQEINQLTSAIGKMNLFLHGIEDFQIANADTLKEPKFIDKGQIRKFDLVLANPPYSISQWDRGAFENDKYGRNRFGTPPQSRADYAFIQHIIASLSEDKGRAAILLPHGVLNRNEEKEIRKAILNTDCVDAVIGLGRHLFYNCGLESCILLLRKNKPVNHRGTVLFIEAEKCTHKVQTQNYLFDEDIKKISDAYYSNYDIEDFSRRVTLDEIMKNDGNLNIKLYVNSDKSADDGEFSDNLDAFLSSSVASNSAYGAMNGSEDEASFDNCSVEFEGFDKTGWKHVKLSDVATEYSERVDDPSTSEYDWYIGSDCIDGFAYRIARKQDAKTIHSAQKLFKKGDYLLVRRSLYGSDFRERAPRADFDGICSADILTIREIPGAIADGYLIAVLYSRRLWDFIVSNSTGSLTRRIKWNQLKDFEFDLPPVELQQKLTELLWSMERTKTAYKNLISATDELVKSQFIEMFGDPKVNANGYTKVTVRDAVKEGYIARPLDGNHGEKHPKGDDYVPKGVPFIMAQDLKDKKVDFNSCHFITEKQAATLKKGWARTGDVLLTHKGTIGRVAIVQPSQYETMLLTPQITYYRCLRDLDNEYLAAYFKTGFFVEQLEGMITGTTRASVTITQQENLELIIPPMEMQKQFVDFVNQSDKSKLAAQQALDDLTAAQKALMRQYLG